MKLSCWIRIAGLGVGLVFGSLNATAQSYRVKVEDKEVKFELPAKMVNNVLMVNVRNMVDAMGATMRWDLEKEIVTIWKGNRRIDLMINSRTAIVNNKRETLEEAPFVFKGRVFVPLKFLAIGCGYYTSKEKSFFVLRTSTKY